MVPAAPPFAVAQGTHAQAMANMPAEAEVMCVSFNIAAGVGWGILSYAMVWMPGAATFRFCGTALAETDSMG